MNATKKLLALALTLLLVIGLFAGCGGKDEPSNNQETAENVQTTDANNDAAAAAASGTTYDTGKFKAPVPAGWKEFPQKDVFSDDDNALDDTALSIGKGATDDWDLYSKPYVYIRYNGPSGILMEPDRDFYDNVVDLGTITTGRHTWAAFSGESIGTPLTILYEDLGDVQLQVTVYTEMSGGTITLEDADVQQILAGIEITDPDAAGSLAESPEATEAPATPDTPDAPTADEGDLGLYRLYELDGSSVQEYAALMGMSVEDTRNSFTVELLEDGKAILGSGDEYFDGNWTLDGDTFTLFDDEGTYPGTLRDGFMVIELDGATVIFAKDSVLPDEPEGDASAAYDWWNGSWYGWISFYDCGGEFADYTDTALDAYADITVNGDGSTGAVMIFHTFGDRNLRFADVDVLFTTGTGVHGAMIANGGMIFPDGVISSGGDSVTPADIENGWYVDPAFSTVSQFDHMIEIAGIYEDPADDDNYILYYIYLRPWGMTWDDVREGDTEDCIYEDMMPMYYDDWYLPLLELGYTEMVEDYDQGVYYIENNIYADNA